MDLLEDIRRTINTMVSSGSVITAAIHGPRLPVAIRPPSAAASPTSDNQRMTPRDHSAAERCQHAAAKHSGDATQHCQPKKDVKRRDRSIDQSNNEEIEGNQGDY
jgi:hypothetical protein